MKLETFKTPNKKIKQLVIHFIRYGFVGCFVYFFDFIVYSIIVWIKPEYYQISNVAGRLTGAVLGFIAHKNYTFAELKHSKKDSKKNIQFVQYLALLCFNILLSANVLYLLIKCIHITPFVARVGTDIIVIVFSFLVSKMLIFNVNV